MTMMMPPPPPFVLPPFPLDDDLTKPRKRTRTSPEQLAILEKSFNHNPSPNSRVREQLSFQLGMPERSIQIWFQNRRAKVKNQAKRTLQVQDKTRYMQQQMAASAAAAACQTAEGGQDTNFYNYYYCYYFNQIQQQHQQQQQQINKTSLHIPSPLSISTTMNDNGLTDSISSWMNPTSSMMPGLSLSASTSSSSSTSDNRPIYRKHPSISSERMRAHSVGPYPHRRNKLMQQERHSSLGPPSSHQNFSSYNSLLSNGSFYDTSILEEATSCLPSANEQQHTLTAETLQIGVWKRVCDLVCQVDFSSRKLVWFIGDDNQQQNFRMDISLDLVRFVRVQESRMEFFISQPEQIHFYMTDAQGGDWIQCHDFTQDQQGSSVNLHVLDGFNLKQEWMEILLQAPELESLLVEEENAHNPLLFQGGLHLTQ
ncbi:hypothetical protein BY458DRAFT_537234 [Sporodiniella umbellata]|nr:hypothetical protein BY458DRAFT_537234 [Sporodiniella umbellata]